MLSTQTRHLVRHFVRGYLSPELLGGERVAAVAAAILISPGLFITVLIAARYVMEPFPLPAVSALGGFSDRLLFFSTSTVLLALVAVLQWDRLALDARDAAILGVLPLPHGQVLRAKWLATAIFAGSAAVLLTALPSLIHPIVSVGRLQASWSLVLGLTSLQFVLGVTAGAGGFLFVLTIRETLWALLGPRAFARASAAMQAVLVVGCVLAFFLLPQHSTRALRDGGASARWLPPVAMAGAFEEAGGHRVAALPVASTPPRVMRRANAAGREYQRYRATVSGSGRRVAAAAAICLVLLAVALAFNSRHPMKMAALPAGTQGWPHLVLRRAWRIVVPRAGVRAGATFTWRTLIRSQPHRLTTAIGLAAGLAAGGVAMFQDARAVSSLAAASPAVLSLQTLVVIGLTAGTGVALRRGADARAAWVFALAWPGDRAAFVRGAARAAMALAGLGVLILLPVHWSLLGAAGAALHAAVGLALALWLVECLLLATRHVPLVDEPQPVDAGRALPALAAPLIVALASLLAAAERSAPIATTAVLLILALGTRAAQGRVSRSPRLDEPGATDAITVLGLID